MSSRRIVRLFAVAALFLVATRVRGQDMEPRRWSHLPIGANYMGAGYLRTEADIFFDPVLKLEDVTSTIDSIPAKYVHAFGLWGKLARAEIAAAYQDGTWKGLLDGAPRQVERTGWGDPVVRFGVNLIGPPNLSGREFAAYRATASNETIVGAALAVQLPLGQYYGDKLINLGQNRYVIRPQVGGVKSCGPWSLELNGSVWFFTDNDDFYIDQTREQEPIYSVDTHLIYSVKPGVWFGVSGGYGLGGESIIGGASRDDQQETIAWALSAGVALTRKTGVKFAYVNARTQTDLGSDTDSYGIALSHLW